MSNLTEPGITDEEIGRIMTDAESYGRYLEMGGNPTLYGSWLRRVAQEIRSLRSQLFDVEAVVREIEELDEIGWGTEFCDCGIGYDTYGPRKRGFGTHIRKADVLSILRRHSEKGATK